MGDFIDSDLEDIEMGQVFIYHLLDKPLPGPMSDTSISFLLEEIPVDATVPFVLLKLIEIGNIHVKGKLYFLKLIL